jgi:pyruvate/2-oxoglutarate dehydrogenase complex dihydrolipoamide acyltransferase (E2) component
MMTKEELHALAAPGVAQKVAAMELELATYQKEWPELFISPTAPQLLKLPRRNGHNGHWPIVVTKVTKKATHAATAPEPTPPTTTINAELKRRKMRAAWTPERRAKMARLMKKRQKALHAGKAAKKAAKKAGQHDESV